MSGIVVGGILGIITLIGIIIIFNKGNSNIR